MTTHPTVEEIRAQVVAAKVVAEQRFTEATGCATAHEFISNHLRHTIAGSASPQAAMRAAIKRSRREPAS